MRQTASRRCAYEPEVRSKVRRIALAILTALIGLLAAPFAATASESEAFALLRAGGHIALMRHADAPGGFGDPAGFKLEACETQRNLSQRGRDDAAAMGALLRREGVRFAAILSSPWCRCLDTARLLDLGPVEVSEAFSNIVVLADRRTEITRAGRAVIDAWRGAGTLLIVTHGANIQALGGPNPASGEMVIARMPPGEAMQVRARLPVPQR